MASVVTVSDLALKYPNAPAPVIEGLNLSIEEGEFLAVVGGSGVGKSSLLRAVADLIDIEHGTVEVTGALTPGRRRRAIVFQDGRLMPWRTLAGNIHFGLEGLNLSETERQNRIEEALSLTGLGEFGDRYPHQLSGGQVQRGGIARALAVQPDILLMDEPFSAVDAITRVSLQDELTRIWTASGCAVLFVTHDINEAVFLADRVIVLGGSPAQVALDKKIDLPRPRDRASTEAAHLATEIEKAL